MKRYDLAWNSSEGMLEWPTGDYILHSDHAAEVAALRADLAVTEKLYEESVAAAYDRGTLIAERDAALAALEGVKRDAERYRWLRDFAGDDDYQNARLNFQTAPMFDAAIDTLMIIHDPARDVGNFPGFLR